MEEEMEEEELALADKSDRFGDRDSDSPHDTHDSDVSCGTPRQEFVEEIPELLVSQLMDQGYPREAAIRALTQAKLNPRLALKFLTAGD